MSLIHTIIAFIVALGVLIVVHEYGHYIVARLCGVKVLRFSVGFGRALATWRLGADQTEWVVAHQTVFHDASRPSRLILPVIPPTP